MPFAHTDASIEQQLMWMLNLGGDEDLQQSHKVESPFATHLTFQHYIKTKQVLASEVKIHIKKDKSIVIQDYILENNVTDFDDALPYLLQTENGLVSVSQQETKHPIYPKYQWVDANGNVLKEALKDHFYRDTTVFVNVFAVNPINSANTEYGGLYVDNKDSTNSALEAEQQWFEIPARFRNDTFFLESEYMFFEDISFPTDTSAYWQMSDSFNFTRNQLPFEAANAYYHINTMGAYVSSLGYDSILTRLKIDVHALSNSDNSKFSLDNFTIQFGQGGVDDAEDAEVVIHEYAHSFSQKASPKIANFSAQRSAMEEGQADYLCKAYSRTFNDNTPNKIFTWDGHNPFFNGFEINSGKKYPEDLKGSKDQDRDIWSSVLMCAHDQLGRRTMDSVVLESMYYQSDTADMIDMANVILDIDSSDFNSRNYIKLKGCFVDAGILFHGVTVPEEELLIYGIKNSYAFSNGAGNLIIDLKDESNVSIVNSLGQVMFSQKAKRLELNPSEFIKGVYILNVELNGINSIVKIVR